MIFKAFIRPRKFRQSVDVVVVREFIIKVTGPAERLWRAVEQIE